eukprot:3485120-Pyramimonas_sp.AAC.1
MRSWPGPTYSAASRVQERIGCVASSPLRRWRTHASGWWPSRPRAPPSAPRWIGPTRASCQGLRRGPAPSGGAAGAGPAGLCGAT